MSLSDTTITPNKTLPPSGLGQGSTTTGAGSGTNASVTDAVLGTMPRTVLQLQG